MLYKETIGPELARVARALVAAPELAAFRIVGGTAVALQGIARRSTLIFFQMKK